MIKKYSLVKTIVFVVMLSILLLITGCSNNETNIPNVSNYDLLFTVSDESDNPLEDATVTVDNEDKLTDSSGIVSFSKQDGTYNYSVTASGYASINDTITVNGADLTEDINLQIGAPPGYIGIYNWEDLDNIRNDLTANYILMNNLDSTTSGYDNSASSSANGGKGWSPIGDSTNKFKGKFDGGGFTISNLFIDRPYEEYIGLFGFGDSVELVNIILDSVDISGKNFVGSIIGYGEGISDSINDIDNCEVTGSVSGNENTGGLIGRNDRNSVIKNSTFNGQITGINDVSYIGGIIGFNFGQLDSNSTNISLEISGSLSQYIGGIAGQNDQSITNCNAEGTITITSTNGSIYGGLVGRNEGSINNSYSTVNITGINNTGGLVGFNDVNGSLYKCYSAGTISGRNWVGGLIGNNYGNLINCYNTGDITGTQNQSQVGGLVGYNDSSQTSYIEYCYSTGNPENISDIYLGGLVGNNDNVAIYNSFTIYSPSMGPASDAILDNTLFEITATEMQTESTFTDGGWDFTTIWDIDEGNSSPYLQENMQDPLPVVPTG